MQTDVCEAETTVSRYKEIQVRRNPIMKKSNYKRRTQWNML